MRIQISNSNLHSLEQLKSLQTDLGVEFHEISSGLQGSEFIIELLEALSDLAVIADFLGQLIDLAFGEGSNDRVLIIVSTEDGMEHEFVANSIESVKSTFADLNITAPIEDIEVRKIQ